MHGALLHGQGRLLEAYARTPSPTVTKSCRLHAPGPPMVTRRLLWEHTKGGMERLDGPCDHTGDVNPRRTMDRRVELRRTRIHVSMRSRRLCPSVCPQHPRCYSSADDAPPPPPPPRDLSPTPQMCRFMCSAKWSDREKHLRTVTETEESGLLAAPPKKFVLSMELNVAVS